MRHRVKIFDAGFIFVVLLAVGLVALEVDIILHQGHVTQHEQTIELDELLILATLFVSGALFYTWRRAREHKRENAARIAAEGEVLQLALHDPLTGLPNRRQFDQALKAALEAVPAAPEAHAVLLLDLNGFKKINDVHGHPVGDQVLIHVGLRLLRAAREGDLVARLGGDEFVVLARNVAGPDGAASIGLRILEGLTEPVAIGGLRHQVGASIGIALAPQDGVNAEELLRKADVALYRAKSEKKSGLHFFEEAMDERLRERDRLEKALLADMGGAAFQLFFRPAAGAGGAAVARLEAQLVWRSAEFGDLAPERFVPVAEEAGVLAELVEGALARACAEAVQWPATVRLAYNLPGPLLHDAGLAERLLSVIAGTGLSPARIELEIDEGALVRDTAAAHALIGPLREAGVAVVADHFGTGYSNIQNLQKLKLDGVKIDPSFVAAMVEDSKAAAMVRALVAVGQGFELSVRADGVRTAAQEAALAAQGCQLTQGDLYGGPLTAAQALAAVRGGGTGMSGD
ncbi:diguanylate cyclase (GGDEF)-like protein [Sphingopyxis panaciterrae]|uniref:putative bifunctional diguanylate cyclase/phosphodiesterase n=1 Tax=Sphingopyxis panaciterrae TaxID=363841 RepID=UPI00142199B3|nr:EAL domain-containing protein [Sphingopyxis panaciterrae]NIJ35859.1 diguanylate cyclase (GGDEF)-like protein [Sphingopyxis panaciterrae]